MLTEQCDKGQVTSVRAMGCITEEGPWASETPIFYYRLHVNLPSLCMETSLMYLIGNKPPYTLEGDTVSVFDICLLCRHPWKDGPEHKASNASTFKICRNSRGPWEIMSLQSLPSYAFLLPVGKTCHHVIQVASWYYFRFICHLPKDWIYVS